MSGRSSTAQGRETGPPTYIGVGSLWSGTNWWHDLLLAHPQIEARKEGERSLYFFTQFCAREMTDADVQAYRARFPRRPGKIVGEWTQRYMSDPWAPLLLSRAAPEAKLLVLVSDPVERYRTKLATELAGREDEEVGYFMSDIISRGRYAAQLRNLWAYFDPASTLVLQYEHCRADPLGQYRRTLRFLGVRDDFDPFKTFRHRLARMRGRLVGGGPPPTTDLWPELEGALRLELEPEVRALQELVPSLDLSLWPGFSHLAMTPSSPAPSVAS